MSRRSDQADAPVSDTWAAALRVVGYTVGRELLGPSEVGELRAAFGPAAPGSTLHVKVAEHTPARDRWLSPREHPAVAKLFDDLLGDYDVTVHGRDPGEAAGGQGLHADRPPGRIHELDGITVLWMLDEFLVENGATRLVPRSHRGSAAVPRRLSQPGIKHPDEIVVTGGPGDALIF